MGFLNLEKGYDRVNREVLYKSLRIYDVGGKLWSGIKSMYVNSLACVRVKRGNSECFRIENGVRQGCGMSPWFFNVYMDSVMKVVKTGMRKSEECLIHFMQTTWFCVVSQRRT